MKPAQNAIPEVRRGRQPMPADWDAECYRIFMLDRQERIEMIKRGAPPELVGHLAKIMDVPKQWLIGILGMSRATISRKEHTHTPLSVDESERVFGVQCLIGQLEDQVLDGGEPAGFDPAKYFGEWLDEYQPALGGRNPSFYMDTIEGQKLLSGLLAAAADGAYW